MLFDIECSECNGRPDYECTSCMCQVCFHKTNAEKRYRCFFCRKAFHEWCRNNRDIITENRWYDTNKFYILFLICYNKYKNSNREEVRYIFNSLIINICCNCTNNPKQ